MIFVDPCIIVQFIKKNPTRCNNVRTFLLFHIYMKLSMFRATQRPSSGAQNCTGSLWFLYVESFWMCSWWTWSGTLCLKTSTNYKNINFLQNILLWNICLQTQTFFRHSRNVYFTKSTKSLEHNDSGGAENPSTGQ
jgi:hypothetical protein